MKLSFSTNAFVEYSISEAVSLIAQAGYEGTELLADKPHLFADSITHQQLEELSHRLKAVNLTVANINANTASGFYVGQFFEPIFEPSLAHPHHELRKWRVDYTQKCIEMAAYFKCDTISITSGKPIPGILPKDSLALFENSLEHLIKFAQERNVRIGIEYEPGMLIENCNELANLIERMNSDYLGANLDFGHSYVLGEDSKQVIRLLGNHIFHIHIEDIQDRKHYHLIPGRGDINFAELFELLHDRNYNGYVTVELYTYPHMPYEAAIESIRFLRKLSQ